MKISPFNFCTNFYGSISNVPSKKDVEANKEIRSISKVTPDFSIKVPQNYKKIRTDKLPNDLTLYRYKTNNGYTVSVIPKEDAPACVSVTVDVGSDNEPENLKGISHFIEHMLFNGTKGTNGYLKLEPGDFEKKVKKLGGFFNGITTFDNTTFFINAPLFNEKDLEEQIKLLSAIIENPKFTEEMIEKEKKVVCSEICMYNDIPYQKALQNSTKTLLNLNLPNEIDLVAGSIKNIENLTRKDVLDYYNKYYSPQNSHIVVTGDVEPEEVMQLISKNFAKKNNQANEPKYHEKYTPITQPKRTDMYSPQTKFASAFLSFVGPKNSDFRENIKLDIAQLYLSSSENELSKKMHELNSDCLFNDTNFSNNPDNNNVIIIKNLSTEKNIEEVLHSTIDIIKSTKHVSKEKLDSILKNIKDTIETCEESSLGLNDKIRLIKTNDDLDNYLKTIEILSSITPEEINETIKKYFDFSKCAITVLHPQNKKDMAFNGKVRKPLNENKILNTNLKNNIHIGFYKTPSKKRIFKGEFAVEQHNSKKLGVEAVLNAIYKMGTKDLSMFEFQNIIENLNLSLSCNVSSQKLFFELSGNDKNYKEGLKYLKELIYNPRITEETLKKAKEMIKDDLENIKVTSSFLFEDKFLPAYNKEFHSNKELLNNLNNITLEDVKDFHSWLLNNSVCRVAANIPEDNSDEIKNNIISSLNGFKEVKPDKIFERKKLYKNQEKPVVLTSVQNDKQADISMAYLFKYDDTIDNDNIVCLFNQLLNQSSIGLYEIIREKEKLGYTVNSAIDINNDMGTLFLKILTTTDDKENGVKSFDNLKRSIESFKHIIKEFSEEKFTDEDLENAKLFTKSEFLNNEQASDKINSIYKGLNPKYGINYYNKIFENIDKITKEDIINFAKSISSISPVYSITASKDTLEANKEYLKSLQN